MRGMEKDKPRARNIKKMLSLKASQGVPCQEGCTLGEGNRPDEEGYG